MRGCDIHARTNRNIVHIYCSCKLVFPGYGHATLSSRLMQDCLLEVNGFSGAHPQTPRGSLREDLSARHCNWFHNPLKCNYWVLFLWARRQADQVLSTLVLYTNPVYAQKWMLHEQIMWQYSLATWSCIPARIHHVPAPKYRAWTCTTSIYAIRINNPCRVNYMPACK